MVKNNQTFNFKEFKNRCSKAIALLICDVAKQVMLKIKKYLILGIIDKELYNQITPEMIQDYIENEICIETDKCEDEIDLEISHFVKRIVFNIIIEASERLESENEIAKMFEEEEEE